MVFLQFITAIALLSSLASAQNATACKQLPGDSSWPSADTWSNLNDTINGRLIKTIPQAHVCHVQPYNDYDAAACQSLQDAWDSPPTL